MGFRLSLIAAILLVLVFRVEGKCIDCHRPHYRERGSCSSCHLGIERGIRKATAHEGLIPAKYASFGMAGDRTVHRGQELVRQFACRRCHIIASKGSTLASNLDAGGLVPADLLVAISTPALYMPDFRCDQEQMGAMVTYLLAVRASQNRSMSEESPRIVYFATGEGDTKDPFANRCGGCHRILSQNQGGLGFGVTGPNLSGLFSPFYPSSLPGGERWDRKKLRKWISNPRSRKSSALMQPIDLPLDEFNAIVNRLTVSPDMDPVPAQP